MQCIKKCKKKNKKPFIINILCYNIFPIEGWIFNCIECELPTSNSIILDKFEIYICKSCLIKKKKDKYYKKKYIYKCRCLYSTI